jgi:hypothetical protein
MAVFSSDGCHTVSYVHQPFNIQVTFSISKVNFCLDRPAIAEVIEVRLIPYGARYLITLIYYIITILCFVLS